MTVTSIEDRTIELACYIVENKATIRTAADYMGISKSVAHSDINERLPALNPALYVETKEVLAQNFAERQVRGGYATQRLMRSRKGQG